MMWRAISAAGGGMVAPEPPSRRVMSSICMVVKYRASPVRSISTIKRETRARSRELSLMNRTCGSFAYAIVSGMETSAPSGIEIERDRKPRLARDCLEKSNEILPCRGTGKRPLGREQLNCRGIKIFGQVCELDRHLHRRMGHADHHRDPAGHELDRGPDQGFALFEAEICVFLRFHPGCDDHGGAASIDDVVDLVAQLCLVHLQLRSKGCQRRDDEARILHFSPSTFDEFPTVRREPLLRQETSLVAHLARALHPIAEIDVGKAHLASSRNVIQNHIRAERARGV